MIKLKFFKKTIVKKVNNELEDENTLVDSTSTELPTDAPLFTLMIDDDVVYEKEEILNFPTPAPSFTEIVYGNSEMICNPTPTISLTEQVNTIIEDVSPITANTITLMNKLSEADNENLSLNVILPLMVKKNYSLGFTTLSEVCSHFVNGTEVINRIDGETDESDFCQSLKFEISLENQYKDLIDGQYWLSDGIQGRKVLKNGLTLNFISDCISCNATPNTLFVKYNIV